VRVVHVYKDIFPIKGGIENYVLGLCARLRRNHGIDAQILVAGLGRTTEQEIIDGVPTTKAARLATVASTPISWAMPRLLRELKPDLVHLHMPHPMGDVSYLLAAHAIPMVITYHSDVVRQAGLLRVYGPILDLVLRRAQAVLATSPQYKASSPWLRRHRARCRIVPLGIDQERFRQPDAATLRRAAELRQRYGPHVLHSHGVFRYYKGLRHLVDAMRLLPGAHLMLTGQGPEEAALKAQVKQYGLGERVFFPGPVSDEELPAYFQAADIYVLPAVARSEAFGLSMVEAQATGLPCISTDIGTGTSYVNLHGVTGLVVAPGDSASLADAARTLLDDADLRQSMGRQGQRRAAELFDLDASAAAVMGVYRSVMSQ